jgi:hypothetical protein
MIAEPLPIRKTCTTLPQKPKKASTHARKSIVMIVRVRTVCAPRISVGTSAGIACDPM